MSLGVCLPGGGAKGAFQAGVLEALYTEELKNMIHMHVHQLGR